MSSHATDLGLCKIFFFFCCCSFVGIRVTTPPGKPGKVGEFQSGQGKVRESEIKCVFSSSKYSKTRFSARAPPRTPLGELTTLPQIP